MYMYVYIYIYIYTHTYTHIVVFCFFLCSCAWIMQVHCAKIGIYRRLLAYIIFLFIFVSLRMAHASALRKDWDPQETTGRCTPTYLLEEAHVICISISLSLPLSTHIHIYIYIYVFSFSYLFKFIFFAQHLHGPCAGTHK